MPLIAAPRAISNATFSFVAHSAYIPTFFESGASVIIISLDGVPG